MTSYFIRRLLLMIPTFLGITVMVFIITRFVPGGPIERAIAATQQMALEHGSDRVGSTQMSEEQLKELKAYYGFDKPVLVSYGEWLLKVLRWDLGHSTRYYEPVWDIIRERFPVSIFYGLSTMVLTYLVCIPLGILKALKHKTGFDNISSIVVFIGYAIPGFVVGILCIVYLASKFDLFPIGGFYSDEFDDLDTLGQIKDILYHAVLPLIAYMTGSFAAMTFIMKNSLMDHLSSDYVRTAIAKGVPFNRAVLGHALKNSLVPLATHFGNNISVLLSGSFLIEKVFDIDGLGLLGYDSVVQRDYPVVMGILVIACLLQLFGNILSDVCVALVEPRVQFD